MGCICSNSHSLHNLVGIPFVPTDSVLSTSPREPEVASDDACSLFFSLTLSTCQWFDLSPTKNLMACLRFTIVFATAHHVACAVRRRTAQPRCGRLYRQLSSDMQPAVRRGIISSSRF